MKKKFLPLLALAFALLLPSCIEYETEVTLNKDGSGTITEEMIITAQGLNTIQQFGGQPGDRLDPMKDEATAKAKAKSYGEGVTFVKAEEIKTIDGGKGVRVTYKFTDINKLSLNPSAGFSDLGGMKPGEKAAPADNEPRATFKYTDGTLVIKLPQPEAEEVEDDGDAAAPADFDPNDPQTAMMTQMMKGMRMGAKITMAEGIAATTATYQKGDTITLFEMEMDKLMQNPADLGALKGVQKQGPEAVAKALQKIDGVKFETKKEVTVTSK